MPTYDYRCKACGHELEIQQSFSDDALTICPNCGEPQLRKVFSAVGISFKGSGFYKNDSRGGKSSSGSGSSSSTKSESSSSADSSSTSSTSSSSGGDSSGSSGSDSASSTSSSSGNGSSGAKTPAA